MGSYRCAVLSGSHQILSEEGSIQLEGEFIFSSLTCTATQKMLCLNGGKTLDPNSFGSFLGLPHFSLEPQHMSIVANVSLSLRCVAHGPPEPVRVIWLQDGAPLNSLTDPVALSPSTLNLTGIFLGSHNLVRPIKADSLNPLLKRSHFVLSAEIKWYIIISC